MTRTVVRRLLSVIPVMAVVAVIVFLLLHLAPGDPAAIMAGDNATPENIANIRTKLGLDQPIWWQFLTWMGTLLRGDLGRSMFWGDSVFSLVAQRAPPTISLAITTLVVAVSLALVMGVAAAARAGTVIDRLVMAFAALGFSVPVFVVGYFLIFFFAIQLRWLPVQGFTPISEGLWPWLRNLILP
ncbi:MAG: ABC transporter permease, partial [Acetobacteraceae bacterium]|nr:ABC transporter permease [Acetobacteraceae bacterium]